MFTLFKLEIKDLLVILFEFNAERINSVEIVGDIELICLACLLLHSPNLIKIFKV